MNRADARKAVDALAVRYVGRAYDDLSVLVDGELDVIEVAVAGVVYQVEFNVYWDDKPHGVLRLAFNVDDKGRRAFFPLCFCDLVGPLQTFQGALA